MHPPLGVSILALSVSLGTAVAHADTYLVQGQGSSITFSYDLDPSQLGYAKPYAFTETQPIVIDDVAQTATVVYSFADATYGDNVSVFPDVGGDFGFSTATNWYTGGGLLGYPVLSIVPLTITPGTYALEGGSGDGTLTVTDVSTPEPGTFALLGTGALGAVANLRRKLAGG